MNHITTFPIRLKNQVNIRHRSNYFRNLTTCSKNFKSSPQIP